MGNADLIRKWDDPILKKICDPVAAGEDVRELMASMDEACRRHKGVGLAAPQVGVAKRVIFTLVDGGRGIRGRFFINPIIVDHSPAKSAAVEGCLSYPGIQKMIERWTRIDVQYIGRNGQLHDESFFGYAARVMQHEIDHLDGICRVGDSSAAVARRSSSGTKAALAAACAIGVIAGMKSPSP